MTLFRTIARPIWRQTWLRLFLLSGSTAGLLMLVAPRLPSEWLTAVRIWAASIELSPADGERVEFFNETDVEAEQSKAKKTSVNTQTYPLQSKPEEQLSQLDTTGVVRPYMSLTKLSHELIEDVLLKEHAVTSYRQAIGLAQQAMSLRKQGDTPELRQQEEKIWQNAVRILESIDRDSAQHAPAQAKLKEYGTIATVVSRRIHQDKSSFLKTIAAESGDPNAVRISLCQLGTEACRSFLGDVPPASIASLVKLPLAMALMHQVTTGKASLDELIYIDPSNFTENAQGAKIFVDKKYTLREVMVRMITESNNIATNQLIDYMGYDAINEALKAEGFSSTVVGHKLVGSSTYPESMGSGRNRSTADELTQMMMRIYSFTKASDEEILNALVGQYDLDFGYRALIKEKPDIFWIGEKTGQNSLVIGSTVAFKVGEERYVMTVTIDKTKNQARLRQVIRDVAKHVLEHGPLEQQAPKLARRI